MRRSTAAPTPGDGLVRATSGWMIERFAPKASRSSAPATCRDSSSLAASATASAARPGRERVVVDEPERLAGAERNAVEERVREVGVRREVALADGAEHPYLRRLAVVQRRDETRRDLRPDPCDPGREPVRHSHHHRADGILGRERPLPDAMAPEQAAVEAGDLVGGDAHPLPRRHAGGHAVDGVSALDRPLDDAARLAHALDGVGRDLDGLVRPRSAYDLVDREVAAP